MSLLQEAEDRARALGIPFALHLDVTYRCNERCVHCYLDHEDRGELTNDEIKRVLREAADAGTFILTISGGEPMLRKDFFDIVEYARMLTFAVKIKTNGLLIGDAEAARLRQLAINEIQISVYSDRPEVHDAITKVRGSLERSMNAVKSLKRQGLNVVMANALMRQNVTDYRAVQRMGAEIGVPVKTDPTITPMIDGDTSVLLHRIGTKELGELFQDPELVGDVNEFCALPDPLSDDILGSIPCSAGHSSLYVSPYGEVYPCVQFPVPCGNIRSESLQDIWYKSPSMREVRGIRIKDLHTCSSCDHVTGCSRCPGLAYMEGDMRGPSTVDCEKSAVKAGVLAGVPGRSPKSPRLVQIQVL